MKMRKMIACISTAAIILVQCPISAAASSLSREELIEKYGYLLQEEKGTTKTWYSEAHGDASFMPKTGEVVRSGKADGFQYEILDTGKARINGLDDAQIDTGAETLIIPDTIDGCTVTEIGYRAFENCYKNMPAIKEIYIPDSVEIIAEGAFAEAFCDSRHIGPGDVGPDGAAPEGAKINIPNNVVFIGFEAFNFDLFAISNAQNGDRIIHLPEFLEYISYTAFGWIDRRYKGGFEIDMPKSLVFMSDYCFDAYAVHGNIRTQQVQQVIMDADSFHKEDLPLLMNEMNQSFYQGERNIVTMGDIFGAKVKVLEEYSKLWYNQAVNDSSAMFVHACKLAAQYAPDLLPENVRAAAEAKNYSDMKVDQTPDIAATGDIDQNGEINIADAILLARYIAEDNDITITEEGITAADLDADGYVTAMDQNILLELIAHADF